MHGTRKFTRRLKVYHYLAFAAILAIGIFNAVTALAPVMQQRELEKNIALSFEKWWQEEGAPNFKMIGLPVNDSARAVEFVQYRERVLSSGKSFDVEERIKAKRKEFREWWEVRKRAVQVPQELQGPVPAIRPGFHPEGWRIRKAAHLLVPLPELGQFRPVRHLLPVRLYKT